jgi:hypothetical protein
MYGPTAASASAGTNPTLTAKNLVYHGEQDTSGAAVTATRNYAYQGKYISADTAIPGNGTRTSFSGNIGSRLMTAKLELRNYITEGGFSPGMISQTNRGHATYATPVWPTIEDQNILSVVTGDASGFGIDNRTTGAAVGVTAANWRMFVSANRTF